MKARIRCLCLALALLCSYGSAQWVITNGPLVARGEKDYLITCLGVSDTNLLAGIGYRGGLFRSTNRGDVWTEVTLSTLYKATVYAIAVNGTDIFAGGWGNPFLSTDQGAHWTLTGNGAELNARINSLAVIGTNLFAGSDSGRVFLSPDRGASWTSASSGLPKDSYVTALAVIGTNLFAGTWDGVYRSVNSGSLWTPVNIGMKGRVVNALAVIGTKLFAGAFGGVYVSTDSGASWIVGSGLELLTISSFASSGTSLFAGAGFANTTTPYPGGVFLSTNSGASWTRVNTGLIDSNITALAVAGTSLFAGSDSGMVWRRPLSDMIGGQPGPEVGVWQEIPLYPTLAHGFSTNKDDNIVTFDTCRAKVINAWSDSLVARVPENLVGPRAGKTAFPDTTRRRIHVRVRIVRSPGDTALVCDREVIFVFPRPLLFDEVTRSTPPLVQAIVGDAGPIGTRAFFFLGDSNDGTAALRVSHTSTSPLSLSLLMKVISPTNVLYDASSELTPGNIFNLGVGDAGEQFPVVETGLYLIVVEAASGSSFPSLFQVHIAGNVGLPLDFPRGTRLDTYFNHPAPREEALVTTHFAGREFQETGLFKFGNPLSISRFPIAVLIPPSGSPGGFPLGVAPVRAAPPAVIADPTVPGAPTPGVITPVPGTVIDLAQVPIPASPLAAGFPPGVAAILGTNNGSGVTLPLTIPVGGPITSLIVDMGSGNEIVDGTGKDFTVYGMNGTYSVGVSNTPFVDDFKSLGTGTGETEFDIAGTGLTCVRYVSLAVTTGSVTIDAVKSLHFFVDQVHPTIGPIADAGYATITMRRLKSPIGTLDPFLELIGVDGTSLGKNDSGFGDDTETGRTDALLVNKALTQQGFYRYLGRGYDWQADAAGAGRFFTRLETGGIYDPVELEVHQGSEQQITAQKQGSITQKRQRDSYLFQAAPGTTVTIVVTGIGSPALPDPLVELYDAEDFLIGASDNATARGKYPAMTLKLPMTGHGAGTLQSPGTYRIVVMGIDGESGTPVAVADGVAHLRASSGGTYELKVFTATASSAFTRQSSPTMKPLRAAKAVTASVAWTCGDEGTVLRTTDSGVHWTQSNPPDTTYDLPSIESLNDATSWVTGVGPDSCIVWKTTNGGSNWVQECSSGNPDSYFDAIRFFDADNGLMVGDPEDGYFMILTTTNGGGTWTRTLSTNIPAMLTGEYGTDNNLALSGNSAWFGTNGSAGVTRVFRSTDRGQSWKASAALNGLGDNLVSITFATTTLGWIQGSNGSVAKSTDGGATWGSVVPTGLSGGGGIQYLGSTAVAVTGGPGGFALSTDNGNSWTQKNVTGVTENLFALSFLPGGQTGWVVGSNGTIAQWSGILFSSVEERQPVEIPSGIALWQNYPNPFNPSTIITYALPQHSKVTLAVFTLLGQQIALLQDGEQEAGYHEVRFDASHLASGAYFYRLEVRPLDSANGRDSRNRVGGFVQTRTFMVLR